MKNLLILSIAIVAASSAVGSSLAEGLSYRSDPRLSIAKRVILEEKMQVEWYQQKCGTLRGRYATECLVRADLLRQTGHFALIAKNIIRQ